MRVYSALRRHLSKLDALLVMRLHVPHIGLVRKPVLSGPGHLISEPVRRGGEDDGCKDNAQTGAPEFQKAGITSAARPAHPPEYRIRDRRRRMHQPPDP